MLISQLFEADFDQYQLHSLSDPKTKEVTPVTNADHLVQIISNNCSDMVAAYRAADRVLLRGAGSSEDSFVTNIRPDRYPVQMDSAAHEDLHLAFLKLGLTATRKNSIFCTTNYGIARSWGSSIYAIFVKDGWTGTVFSEHKIGYSFHAMEKIARYPDLGKMLNKLKQQGPISFNDPIGLTKVLAQKYEDIIITGSSYIGIRLGTSLCFNVLDKLDIKSRNI